MQLLLTIGGGVALGILLAAGILASATRWGCRVLVIAGRLSPFLKRHKWKLATGFTAAILTLVVSVLVSDHRKRQRYFGVNRQAYERWQASLRAQQASETTPTRDYISTVHCGLLSHRSHLVRFPECAVEFDERERRWRRD